MRMRFASLCIFSIMVLLCGCRENKVTVEREHLNAIYHWKTVFNPTPEELAFITRHNVRIMYLRMFDVAVEENVTEGSRTVVPIATTRFDSSLPEGVEVIPTVYITLEALKEMEWTYKYYAKLITERLLAMARYNKCGKIKEVQLDCDWTDSTAEIYDSLCSNVRSRLQKDSIALSVTLRMHQLIAMPPVADRVVLMLYNTGNLKNPDTENSILDIDDVTSYIDGTRKYSLPMDYAYPAFSWGVKFKNGEFECIVSNPDSVKLAKGETLRREEVAADVILKTKQIIEKCYGQPDRSSIIYHLDNNSLDKYTHEEIDKIYTGN